MTVLKQNLSVQSVRFTEVWSQKDYPLIDVGIMTLNKNPENYFATVEQAANWLMLSPHWIFARQNVAR